MELKQLTESVYYYPRNEELDRPVLGYIKGDKYSLMIDAGTSSDHVQEFYQALADKNLVSPSLTAITHWHWDHTFGMHAIEGVTIANSKTNKQLEEMKAWSWTDKAMKERLGNGTETEFVDTHIRKEYKDTEDVRIVAADLVYEETLTLDLGGITAELFHVESPHSDDAIFIHIPEEKVVFIGDAITEDFYNDYYMDTDKLKRLASVIESMDCNYYLHGHTDPFGKQELLDYMAGFY